MLQGFNTVFNSHNLWSSWFHFHLDLDWGSRRTWPVQGWRAGEETYLSDCLTWAPRERLHSSGVSDVPCEWCALHPEHLLLEKAGDFSAEETLSSLSIVCFG